MEENQPRTRLTRAELLEKANTLPLRPGVYVMRDVTGKVIYVGKSRKLKNRVSQYFQNSEKQIKVARMAASVADFDYFLCDTEIEALSLENTLIKEYTPKYNIRLKDAKSYPYIKVTPETYPRLVMTRKRENDKGRYYGPYSGTSTVFSVIGALERIFALPTCTRRFPRDIGKERPCLYYQMGKCCGVCTGTVTPEEYAGRIRFAENVLKGDTAEVKKELETEMFRAAEEERFESAARFRDTVRALDRLTERQKVVASPDEESDVVALYADEVCACVSVFFIRRGAVMDKSDFLFGADRIPDESEMAAFLLELYQMREFIPRRILLSFDLGEDRETLEEYLTGRAGRKITVHTPRRGEWKTLCDMVRDNAEERCKRYRIDTEKEEGALLRLAGLLGLETYPSRIESYDISNFGKEQLTAGMVVLADGKCKRSDYRVFKMKTVEGTDDYASMREALSRRLDHLSDPTGSFSERPDLILLDGGRGHVGVIRELMRERGLDIPVFGMVKDDFHKTRALCSEDGEISIAKDKQVFLMIYQLQEEVHRFTVSRMSAGKRKTLRTSSLEKIPGIGPAKAKALLSMFGGLGKLRAATKEQIAAAKGISETDAGKVYAYLHRNEGAQPPEA